MFNDPLTDAVCCSFQHRLSLLMTLLIVIAGVSEGRCSEEQARDSEPLIADIHVALKAANPEYQNGGTFKFKDGRLISISLQRCKGLTDLSPLTKFPLESVTAVNLYNASNIEDISALKNCPLESLNLERCGKIRDLSPLQGMPLKWLRMYACSNIKDLSPLSEMPIEHLDIGLNPLIDDLSVLKGMQLHDLRIDNCPKITDISVLDGMPLKFLSLFDCPGIKDYSVLGSLKLETLYFNPKLLSKDELMLVRQIDSLQKIGTSWQDYRKEPNPEEFWKRYDEMQ